MEQSEKPQHLDQSNKVFWHSACNWTKDFSVSSKERRFDLTIKRLTIPLQPCALESTCHLNIKNKKKAPQVLQLKTLVFKTPNFFFISNIDFIKDKAQIGALPKYLHAQTQKILKINLITRTTPPHQRERSSIVQQ